MLSINVDVRTSVNVQTTKGGNNVYAQQHEKKRGQECVSQDCQQNEESKH